MTAGRVVKKKEQEKAVQMRNKDGVIQWRFGYESTWKNLMSETDLIGARGEKGDTGARGEAGPKGRDGRDGRNGRDGKDGKEAHEIQLRKSGQYIQWKRTNEDSWKNLVRLEDLRGPEGSTRIVGGGGGANGGASGITEVNWGEILGTITEQTDLIDLLNGKDDTLYNEPLRGWNAALANRATEPAKVVLVGDSILQLYGNNINQRINSLFNWKSDSRYVPVCNSIPDWTSWDGDDTLAEYGLGAWGGELAVGEGGHITTTMNSFILYYTVQKTGGADLEIYIDNVLTDTISTTDAGISGDYESGRTWNHYTEVGSLMASQSHTIRVEAVNSGTAIVEGIFHSNGDGQKQRSNIYRGVQVYNASHTGYKSSDFNGKPRHFEALQAVDPDLFVIMMGTNDFAVGLATFTSEYQDYLDTLETNHPNASFLLVAPYAAVNRSASNWQDFVDIIKSEADTRGMAFLDLFAVMGDVGDTYDTYSLSDDQVHPNTKGGNLMADAIVNSMVSPNVHNTSPKMTAEGYVDTEAFTISSGSSGLFLAGKLFGYPVGIFYGSSDDANPEMGFMSSGISTALGFPNAAFFWGDPSTGIDTGLSRISAGHIGVYGASGADGDLTVQDLNVRDILMSGRAYIDTMEGLQYVYDGSGNLIIQLQANASAANNAKIANAAAGNDPYIEMVGSDADIGFKITLKNNGVFTVEGRMAHEGDQLGFFSATPSAQSTGWAVSNGSTVKSFDADATDIDQLADVVGTIITELLNKGLIGA